MIEKIVTLNGLRWKLVLNESKQLAFALEIPDRLSNWKNDPFWYSFDDTDQVNLPEWSSTFTSNDIGLSPFKIKTFLLDNIATFINRQHVDFFYFTPTSKKRGDIYTNMMKLLTNKLKGKWTYQIINNHWYYFSNDDKN